MHNPLPRETAGRTAGEGGDPAEPHTRAVPGRPAVWWPIMGLAWLGSGWLFATSADHFGPGFLPMLVWTAIYPVVAIVQIVAAIVQFHRYQDGRFGARFQPWRLAVWALAGVAYVLVPIAITLG